MYYYEVLIGDSQFHGKSALTYSSDRQIAVGTVVRIALRDRSVLGLVSKKVPKPSFTAKPISKIADTPPVPRATLKLIDWLYAYYPAPFGNIVRQFLPPSTAFPKGLELRSKSHPSSPRLRRTSEIRKKQNTLALTEDQTKALDQIKNPGSYLLHGITGSGKTRIYQELVARTLAQGKSAIVLTPEIGLTEHLVKAFSGLPAPMSVFHSNLTVAARRDLWYEVLSRQELQIIVGARSALFAPVDNIGLIILDEAHDQAYKNDNSPKYRTDRVAAVLAKLHDAIFLAGTATPNIEDYHAFSSKKLPIVKLNRLAKANTYTVSSKIIDMKDSANTSRSRYLSKQLIEAISSALVNKEQTLLFLNRRGTASMILCSSCGWRAVCSHCDLPLTYHADKHLIRCHTCGRSEKLPVSCPDCNSSEILYKNIGTKALVEETKRLFPTARIARFDSDNEKPDTLEKQLADLVSGKVDIIIGTQMITKGLDLPKLSVVGIINADSSLLMPDFSATERTYQLIGQVVGRVGRGHRAGQIILQTFNPDRLLLQTALSQNYDNFYNTESAERQRYSFPPYCFMARLTCLRATSAAAEKNATKLKQQIENDHPGLKVEGPAPAFHPRESGKYKWQLVIKSRSRQPLTNLVANLPSGWQHDLDPIDLL